MQFYFIRHGQSENNVLWDRTGSSTGRSDDPELTEVGKQQAQIVARFLATTSPSATTGTTDHTNAAGFGITHLYTSLMVRAVATGAALARELNIPLIGVESLHEWGGVYLDDAVTGKPVGQPGHTRSYFARHYPELVVPESCDESGWWKCRPYEEPAITVARAERLMQVLLAQHGGTDDRVALIVHGGFYNHMLRVLFKTQAENGWFSLNNVGITRIDFRADEFSMLYSNRVDFLPRELVT